MKKHKEAVERAGKILDFYAQGTGDPKLDREVQEWLVSESTDKGKATALHRLFYQMVNPVSKPGRMAYEMYRRTASLLGLSNGDIPHGISEKQRSPFRRTAIRIAAVMLPAAILLGGVLLFRHGADNKVNTLEVAVSEHLQKERMLPDHSTVWINSDSRIEYPEEFDNERIVKLNGEAFFKVTQEPSKPFRVETAALEVRVLGTEFNINARPESGRTVVTLHSGKIEIRARKQKMTLSPRQQLTYDHLSHTFEVTDLHPDAMPDWRSDVITLRNKSLVELFMLAGEYYDKTVVFKDTLFGNEQYIIHLDKNKAIDEFLRPLASGGQFAYTISGDTLTINTK